MKKIWMMFFALGFVCCLLKSPNVYANEEEVSTETTEPTEPEVEVEGSGDVKEEPEVFECKVVIKEAAGGTLIGDVIEGHVGDIVTLTVVPGILYELEAIYVNNVKLEPTEEGVYQFVLVEGENTITYSFVVSDEKVEEIAQLIDKVKNKDWDNIFTVDNLIIFLQWVVTTFCSGGFFITLIKLKKNKAMTIEDLNTNVNTNIRKDVNQTVENVLINTIAPIVDNVLNAIVDIKNITNVLTRCTILSQENTPEARLAILKEIDNINKSQEDLTQTVKNLINEEIQRNNEAVKERDQAIEQLKKTNNENEAPHL